MIGGATDDEMRLYIQKESILEAIYNPDNHPEVISKGREIYEFITKKFVLTPKELDYLLGLLDKCHENVCKSVYLTIQALGQVNL